MRLARIGTVYPEYLEAFYAKNPGMAQANHAQQVAAINQDSFAWFDVWSHALEPLGYEVLEITTNASVLLRRWALESGLPRPHQLDRHHIIVEQLRRFRPEVLWFDDADGALLRMARERVPSIRLVLGWTGSALAQTEAWKDVELVLSCSPEAVARLKALGIRSEHMHHAFDPRVLERLAPRRVQGRISFIGQVVRGSEFHDERERILIALGEIGALSIYSPTRHRPALAMALRAARAATRGLAAAGMPESAIERLPHGRKLLHGDTAPFAVDARLRKVMKQGVFGLDAYQVIADSLATLNVHANSSPTHASNMRLFEITGVGTCMLTDWKDNLPELFEPEKECVTYRGVADCVEKARWLLAHPIEAAEIGRAGQARTLAQHTFALRAHELDRVIRRELSRKPS